MLIKNRKLILSGVAAAALTTGWMFAAEETNTAANQTTEFAQADINKLSEAFGHLIGENLENPGLTFNVDSVITGIRNAVAGKESPMTEMEYAEAMAQLQKRAFDDMAEKNLADADTFMKSNGSKKGVVEIETAKLQYEVITEGAGTEVTANSAPTINYVGTYSDGTVFGSSEDGGGPITLPLDQTIPGFNKGLVGMKEGEKRRLYIHPELGYGTSGHLPPNSLLIFDVEIVATDSSNNKAGDTASNTAETKADTIADINTNAEAVR